MHKLAASRHLFCSSQCCQNFPMIFKTILFRVKSIGNKRHNNNYGWFFIVEWLCRRGAAGAGQFKSIISGSLSTHTALIMRTFSNFTKTCHLNQTKENWLWFISSCFVSQLCRCRKQQQLRCRPVGARGAGGDPATPIFYKSGKPMPKRIYNPITALEFSAMFTFQLDNTKM